MGKTYAFVHFNSGKDAEDARKDLNGVKLMPKYSNNKVSKPVRICKYETKQSVANMKSALLQKTNLLVKNIAKDVSAHAFWNLLRAFGDIVSCKLVIDYLGNSKGFGFVNYYREDDAQKAKRELNDKDVHGKLLKVADLETGKHAASKRNNIYVKHIPKSDFSDSDLKVMIN